MQQQKKIQLTLTDEENERFRLVVNRATARWAEAGTNLTFKESIVIRRLLGLPQRREEVNESVDIAQIVTDEDIRLFRGELKGSAKVRRGKNEGTGKSGAQKRRVGSPKR